LSIKLPVSARSVRGRIPRAPSRRLWLSLVRAGGGESFSRRVAGTSPLYQARLGRRRGWCLFAAMSGGSAVSAGGGEVGQTGGWMVTPGPR